MSGHARSPSPHELRLCVWRRCVFESSASSELIVRLNAYPKLQTALEVLPPKMLALSSSAPTTVVKLPESGLETRVEEVASRITDATFTGKVLTALLATRLAAFACVRPSVPLTLRDRPLALPG